MKRGDIHAGDGGALSLNAQVQRLLANLVPGTFFASALVTLKVFMMKIIRTLFLLLDLPLWQFGSG